MCVCVFTGPDEKKIKSKKEKMKERRERWLNSEYISTLSTDIRQIHVIRLMLYVVKYHLYI